jgi:hypothetical protein
VCTAVNLLNHFGNGEESREAAGSRPRRKEDKIWGETGDSVFVLPANLAPRRAEGGIPNVGAGEEDGKKSDYSFSPH